MSYRPYPDVDRARHQLDRHDDETRPQNIEAQRPLTTAEAIERWAASIRAVTPTARQLVDAWNAGLKPRPESSEEKSA